MQVQRICEKCCSAYYVDSDDTCDLCHNCYLDLVQKQNPKENEEKADWINDKFVRNAVLDWMKK